MLLRAFAFVSRLLLIPTIIIWARSYWVGDSIALQLPQFGYTVNDDSIWAMTGRGGIVIGADRRGAWNSGVRRSPWRDPHALAFGTHSPFYPFIFNLSAQGVHGVRLGGFEFASFRDDSLASGNGYGVIRRLYIVTPSWFWGAFFAAAALVALKRFRRLRCDASEHCCTTCGY